MHVPQEGLSECPGQYKYPGNLRASEHGPDPFDMFKPGSNPFTIHKWSMSDKTSEIFILF